MQNRKRDTVVRNRLLDSVGEGEGGMFQENIIKTCILFEFLIVFFPVIEIQSYYIVVRKDDWNDFNFFEFTKTRFMAQDVIYSGEVSMCT